jgi:SAM-dependent methyltransferase
MSFEFKYPDAECNFEFIGVDHIQLAGPKGCEAEARQFYSQLLGWKEIPKPMKLRHRGGVWFRCGIHEVHIGVQESFVPATKAHPGLYVRNIGGFRAYLIQNNVNIIEDDNRAEEGVNRFYLTDPFGNRLEFLERSSAPNTERFSNRVDTYVKYRPSYPEAAIDYLYNTIGFNENSVIADIGAGTGIFSRLLLARGSKVIAVEPNQAMREAAEKESGRDPNFQIVIGSAEATGLPDHSVDYIVCAQAFHWFDRSAAQLEFRRILRSGGKVILIWNSRLTSGTPFLEEYDRLLLTYAIDYERVNHKNISKETLLSFFKKDMLQEERFTLRQLFDYPGLSGRLLSSSYSPVAGHPNYEPMMNELRSLFERNNQDGVILFDYETQVFWSEL